MEAKVEVEVDTTSAERQMALETILRDLRMKSSIEILDAIREASSIPTEDASVYQGKQPAIMAENDATVSTISEINFIQRNANLIDFN